MKGTVYSDPERGSILEELGGLLASAPFLRSFSRRLLDMGLSVGDKTLRHIAQGRIVQFDRRVGSRDWILSRSKAEELLDAVQVLCDEDASAGLREHFEYAEPKLAPYDSARERAFSEVQREVNRLSPYLSYREMSRRAFPALQGAGLNSSARQLSRIAAGEWLPPIGKGSDRVRYVMSQVRAEQARDALMRVKTDGMKPRTGHGVPLSEEQKQARTQVAAFIRQMYLPYVERGQGRAFLRRAEALGHKMLNPRILADITGERFKPSTISDARLAAAVAAIVAVKVSERADPLPTMTSGKTRSEALAIIERRQEAAAWT